MANAQLADLLEERGRFHRVDGNSPPMASVDDLVGWLGSTRLALVSGRSSLPNAAEAIVGRAIRGSWWGDPEASLVYQLLSEMSDAAPDYLELVLVDAKRTIVHPSLVPLATGIAAEPGRRERLIEALRPPARLLFETLERPDSAAGATAGTEATVRPAGGRQTALAADRDSRADLEAGLLARSVSVHTDAGRHLSILEPFGDLPPPSTTSYLSALAHLLEAGLRAAVVAPEGEVMRWLRAVEPDAQRLRDALESLTCRRLTDEGTTWLAPE